MKYTGERIVPLLQGGVDVQHLDSYKESIKHISKNDLVLDIACGSGWGTEMLSHHASQIYGLDISYEAIEYAKENYLNKPGCNFCYFQGSILDIPFVEGKFDVVNSIETFEHVKHEDIETLVRECHRVLKDGGQFIFTTPDHDIYPYHPTPDQYRGYHFWHYTQGELLDILTPYFKEITLEGVHDSHFVVCRK